MSPSPKPSGYHIEVSIDSNKDADDPSSNRLALAQQMSPEELEDVEKKLKRKLDLRLLACVWLIFVFNYLDRVCFCSHCFLESC